MGAMRRHVGWRWPPLTHPLRAVLLLLFLHCRRDVALAFHFPGNPFLPSAPRSVPQGHSPRPRSLVPSCTATTSSNNNPHSLPDDVASPSVKPSSAPCLPQSRLSVRPANKADLRRVATMQVTEYGGQGILYLWHYLQELDRLQTSYWIDPFHHTMLVAVDSTPSAFRPFSRIFQSWDAFWGGDPRIVGFVDLDARDRRVDKTTPTPYLSDLIVEGSRRGQGLGRQLMEAAEDEARRWGYPAVYLKVRKCNARGFGLYASLGYEVLWEWPGERVWMMRKWVVDEEDRKEAEKKEREGWEGMVGAVMMPFMTWAGEEGGGKEGGEEGKEVGTENLDARKEGM